ncbi:hypothetical protein CHELA1G11_10293 [Hyphomicrobiales bacterium]|nr:hypothetical protein CHELA1G11_10293 [Hyphomicrobiales bacterium]CAH1675694.1 hypothetical protein CHELA1G2_14012 [Hyphomicrobiales bacterium]
MSWTVVRRGLTRMAPCRPMFGHQAFDGAAGCVETLAQYLPSDLARAVDLEVLPEQTLDLRLRFRVPLSPGRQLPRSRPFDDMLTVG